MDSDKIKHMKKALLGSARWLFALMFVGAIASASTLTIPNSFTSGTVISSSQMNSNFNSIATWANGNVDHTNINNSAGIYASQLVPTSGAQATFGGSTGYTFTTTLTAPGLIMATPAATPTANAVWLQNDNGGTNGLVINIPSASTNGIQFEAAGVRVGQMTADGLFYGTPHSQTTPAPMAPTYTHAGAAVANTLHTVQDTFQPTISGGNCVPTTNIGTYCNLSSSTVTLTNAAVFTSATSYVCSVSTSIVHVLPLITNTSGTTLTFSIQNSSGGNLLNNSTVDFEYSCTGT